MVLIGHEEQLSAASSLASLKLACVMDKVIGIRMLMRAHLAELDTLFASIQSRAFNRTQ